MAPALRLGHRVHCLVTEVTGIVVCERRYLGAPADEVLLVISGRGGADATLLEGAKTPRQFAIFVDEGVRPLIDPTCKARVHLRLGDHVRNSIDGATGVLTRRDDWLNGCVHFRVSPRARDGRFVRPFREEVQRLERL